MRDTIESGLKKIKPSYWAALALAFLVFVEFVKFRLDPLSMAKMPDPDSWLRLVIVSELAQGGGWYDHSIWRLDPPQGMVSPWTRPLDIALLLLAAPFRVFLPLDDALVAARFLFYPLLLWASVSLLDVGARRLDAERNAMWLLLPVMLISPGLMGYFTIGGVDHHAVLCMLATALWCGYAGAMQNPESGLNFMTAGIVVGLGVWVSVEFEVVAAAFLGMALLIWCVEGRIAWLRGCCLTQFIAAIVLMLAVVVEKPAGLRWVAEYDTVSIVQLATVALHLGFLLPIGAAGMRLSTPLRRFAATAAAIGVALAVLIDWYPSLAQGPMANVSPAMRAAFLSAVAEMQPLYALGPWHIPAYTLYLGLALFLLARYRRQIAWSPELAGLIGTVVALGVLTLLARRMAYYFLPVSALLLLWVLAEVREATWVNTLLRRPSALLALGILPLLLLIFPGAAGQGREGAEDPVTQFLRHEQCLSTLVPIVEDGTLKKKLGKRPLLVGVHGNLGPYLLYRTPYRIISSNYHRDESGYLDLIELLKWEDESAGLALLQKRGVEALILCDFPGSKARLPGYLAHHRPPWAEEVYAHAQKNGATLRVYRVRDLQGPHRPKFGSGSRNESIPKGDHTSASAILSLHPSLSMLKAGK